MYIGNDLHIVQNKTFLVNKGNLHKRFLIFFKSDNLIINLFLDKTTLTFLNKYNLILSLNF